MYLRSIIVLMVAFLANAAIIEDPVETCNGGYCMPKHLCPTGRADDGPMLGQNRRVTVEVGEENECGDFLEICCKKSARSSRQVDYKCGISNPEGLVYNVESELKYAKYAEFPWTVAIFEKSSSRNNPALTHVGGGTLIHPKFVVTTAHTLESTRQYVARFGEWDMKSNSEAFPTQDIEIEEHIKHPSYREGSMLENDIGLAVLKENVIYSEHIQPLCLPNAQDVFEGNRCITTGWGLDIRTRKLPAVMKRMELDVISRSECQDSYWLLDIPYRLHRSVMCAEATDDQNTCVKDGGSPLACQRSDGSYVLAGVASMGRDCNDEEGPGIFVNVPKFACWINDTIANYEETREVSSDEDTREIIKTYVFGNERLMILGRKPSGNVKP